jgi:hypothetical protein
LIGLTPFERFLRQHAQREPEKEDDIITVKKEENEDLPNGWSYTSLDPRPFNPRFESPVASPVAPAFYPLSAPNERARLPKSGIPRNPRTQTTTCTNPRPGTNPGLLIMDTTTIDPRPRFELRTSQPQSPFTRTRIIAYPLLAVLPLHKDIFVSSSSLMGVGILMSAINLTAGHEAKLYGSWGQVK